MKKPDLYAHLSGLSKRDYRRFEDFVGSPMVTQHAETLQLLGGLSAYYPDFEVSDEELFAKSFPNKHYKNARLRVLRTYLLDHFREFVIWTELQERDDLKKRLLISGMDRRGLRNRGRKMLDQAWREHGDDRRVNLDRYFHALKLRELEVDLSIKEGEQNPKVVMEEFLEELDTYYLTSRLRVLCGICNLSQVRSSGEGQGDIYQMTLQLSDQLNLDNRPLVDLYSHLLRLLLGEDTENQFLQLREIVREHGPWLERVEQQNVYGLLINHCLFSSSRGKAGYLETAFEVYQEVVALGLLWGEDAFTAQNYKILISIGVRLGNISWTRNFLEETFEKLPVKWRDDLYHYGCAYLDFAKGAYKEAKRHLLQVEFHDWYYRTSHQNLLMRIYYETNDFESFDSLAQSFQRYLNRSTDISDGLKASLVNLIRFCRKLFDLREKKGEEKGRLALAHEVEGCPHLQNRDWVLAKIQELTPGEDAI